MIIDDNRSYMISIDLIVLITHDILYLAFIVTWFIYDLYRNKLGMTSIDGYYYKFIDIWSVQKHMGVSKVMGLSPNHPSHGWPWLTVETNVDLRVLPFQEIKQMENNEHDL